MSSLTIGKDSMELQAAIRKVQANIRWLNARLENLDRESENGRIAGQFYSDKLSSQNIILDWLICYTVDKSQILGHFIEPEKNSHVVDVEKISVGSS